MHFPKINQDCSVHVLIIPESNKHIGQFNVLENKPSGVQILNCSNQLQFYAAPNIACERCSDLLCKALYIVNALSLVS